MNVKPDPMTVLGVLGVMAFLGIMIAAIVAGVRCPKCKAKAEEISSRDPLERKGVRVTGIPRIITTKYRCPACRHEFDRRDLGAPVK